MENLVANVDHLKFDVEEALDHQLGAQLLPFNGMDKSGCAVCVFYLAGVNMTCTSGSRCPFRHIVGDKTVVCKHWLRGLCKKGDQCEFLHEYDLSKMPECFFFSKYNACSNKECPFRHIDPDSKIRDCPWYDRGFCRHGPHCKNRHRRRVVCPLYLNGFCPEGPNCKFTHPSFDIPAPDLQAQQRKQQFNSFIVCHNCHERGHKATQCPNLPSNVKQQFIQVQQQQIQESREFTEKRPLSEVTCYKCGEKGHYANKCNKGALAFLSSTAHLTQQIRQQDEQSRTFPRGHGMGSRRSGEMMR